MPPGSFGRDIFHAHNWGRVLLEWVEPRDAAKLPTTHKTAPHQSIIPSKMSMVQRLRNPIAMLFQKRAFTWQLEISLSENKCLFTTHCHTISDEDLFTDTLQHWTRPSEEPVHTHKEPQSAPPPGMTAAIHGLPDPHMRLACPQVPRCQEPNEPHQVYRRISMTRQPSEIKDLGKLGEHMISNPTVNYLFVCLFIFSRNPSLLC